MPDITMCYGEDCPLAKDCYRYCSNPDQVWQSWLTAAPYDHEKKGCVFFMNTKGEGNEI